jgi:chromosomal replication initiator protein
MNAISTTTDLDAQIVELEARKAKLLRVQQLRQEVAVLERMELGATSPQVVLQVIADDVCRNFGVTWEQLTSMGRAEAVCIPRHVVFFLAREFKAIPYRDIGQFFGRTHGSVLHGCRSVRNLMETDRAMAAKINQVKLESYRKLSE